MNEAVASERELVVTTDASLGHFLLNRPKVLNSLSLTMVREMETALDRFEIDDSVRAIWMTGAGDRAFCAGGDIRALYDAGKAGEDLPETFWREEYLLDERISRFRKPIISVWNGITMGGGVGLAAHASHRIVIERTRFAMPEAGIGFFPDVGASWLLTRKPSHFGTYVALTGANCGPYETILAGMADHFVPEASLPALMAAIRNLGPGAGRDAVSGIIAGFAAVPTPADPIDRLALIDRCFGLATIEDILDALAHEDDPFAAATRTTLLSKSPTSLKVTLELYLKGRSASDLRTCLEHEFSVTAGMISGHDFYEGVRAAIIDKDRSPRWSPAEISSVSKADVAAYFVPRYRPLFG